MSNKLSQFWQELKRRRVHRLLAIYAGSAYLIFEASTLMLPRWGLPDWTIDLMFYLLLLGAIITVLLGWIYDITPEGIKKTESIQDTSYQPFTSGKRRIKVSDIVISVLLIVVCILLYPRIFRTDQFKNIRDADGRISVVVMPFENLTGDSTLNIWRDGISFYLTNQLGNTKELKVTKLQTVSEVLDIQGEISAAKLSPSLAMNTARKIDVSTYITGSYIGKEEDCTIMIELINSSVGEVIWSSNVNGNLKGDYRILLETLNDTIKNYLEIKALERSVDREMMDAFPKSAEAYRHYIDGLNAIMDWDDRSSTAIESLSKAVDLDSTFTLAAFYLAWAYNRTDLEKTYYWTQKAYDLKEYVPPEYYPWIDLWYACFITEDGYDIRRSLIQLEMSGLNSRLAWFDLGLTYTDWLSDYEKGIEAYEKIEELNRKWDSDWKFIQYYREYAWALVMAGRPDEVERIVQLGLKVNPDDYFLDVMRGARSVFLGDSMDIEKHMENFRSVIRENRWPEEAAEHWIGQMHCWGRDSIAAIKFFRRSYELNPERMNSLILLTWILIRFDVDLEEGLALSELGLSKNPESYSFLRCKGVVLHKMGRHDEALALLKKADEKLIGYNEVLEKYMSEIEQAMAGGE